VFLLYFVGLPVLSHLLWTGFLDTVALWYHLSHNGFDREYVQRRIFSEER
jgi:hypothetical protein